MTWDKEEKLVKINDVQKLILNQIKGDTTMTKTANDKNVLMVTVQNMRDTSENGAMKNLATELV